MEILNVVQGRSDAAPDPAIAVGGFVASVIGLLLSRGVKPAPRP